MKKHRNSNARKTPLRVFVFGLGFSLAILIILSFIASFVILSMKNPLLNIKTASLLVLLSAGAISGFAISKYKGELNLGISIAASIAVAAVMLVASLICSRGKLEGGIFMNYLCYVLVSAFFSFVGRKRKVHRRR